jgi:hypothetical protein
MIYFVRELDKLKPGLNILRTFKEINIKQMTVSFGFDNTKFGEYSTVTVKGFRLFLTPSQIKRHKKLWLTWKTQHVYFQEE